MRLIDAPDFTCKSALGFTPAILSCNVDLAANDIDDAVQIDVRRSNNDLCINLSVLIRGFKSVGYLNDN
jgi:hypothetical protein